MDAELARGHIQQRVLRTALPIVLSNATVPILGAVDTGVVGQLGAAGPIGAVGIGAVILSAIYWIFGFLRMGTTGLAAQAVGREDAPELSAILIRGLAIGLTGGALLTLCQLMLVPLSLSFAPASREVEDLAATYLHVRLWGAPAAIAVFAINGWLIAQERTRAVLVLQLVINSINIALDLWFVLGLGWGVEGVAFATIIAEFSGLGLGLWLCRGALSRAALIDRKRLLDPVKLREMAAVNGDIMVRSIIINMLFLLFMFRSSALGDKPLAANQVLLQFLQITAYALDGFAFAAEALVGQALGRRDVAGLRASARIATQWAVGIGFGLTVFFMLCGGFLIDVITTAPDLRAMAREFLPWVVAAPLVGVWSWMLDGIFIGATRSRDMRVAAIETFVLYLPVLFGLSWLFGNHGLWAALHVSFLVRAVTLWMRYPRIEAAARGITLGSKSG